MSTIESTLPFSGFYYTIWSDQLEREEEQQAEWMQEKWPSLETDEIREVLMDHADYPAQCAAVAKAYVDAFENRINEEFDLGITLSFKEMTSPREYSFTTDRIFVEVSREDLVRLYRVVGRKRVAEKARERFTSRSGFISFYSPDIGDWGRLREWDYNQVGTIFEAAVGMLDGDWELSLCYAIDEKISAAYSDNVDWDRVEADLRHRVDIQNGEAEEDARKFPAGAIRDVKLYQKQFEELNHLRGE